MIILVINPGSTSTKLGIFNDLEKINIETIVHSTQELIKYASIIDQLDFRKKEVLRYLQRNQITPGTLSVVIGRGGLMKPLESGTYEINKNMLNDLREGIAGEHASNLGALIAYAIAEMQGVPAYVVDPVSVDEMQPLARLSGYSHIQRKSFFHALNQKAVGRLAAEKINKKYNKTNIIVAHLGGGITVGAHENGRVIDVNNALGGEGPYTPERTGSLPAIDLSKFVIQNNLDFNSIKKIINGNGGVVNYLKTNNMREVKEMIKNGNDYAKLIYEGMAYQISKEIGAMSSVLKGKVDAIAITGGIAYDVEFVQLIIDRVQHIASVMVFPGESEMETLAEGGYKVLTGLEKAKKY